MKRYTLAVIVQAMVLLSGCGQSAQEKVAQEQLKAIEQQKAMVKGFQEVAAKPIPPLDTSKKNYKTVNPYTQK